MSLQKKFQLPAFSNPRILVVDDDAEHVLVTAKIIQILGATVKTAGDGDQGFEAVKSFNPDIIIADLAMPFQRGDEMLIELRNCGFEKPIIILTGHGDFTSAVQALRHHAFDFLEKPISRDLLLSVVRKALTTEQERLFTLALKEELFGALEKLEKTKDRDSWLSTFLERISRRVEELRNEAPLKSLAAH